MAIVTPILFAMIFAVIQTGLWFHARNVASSAAQVAVMQTAAYDGGEASGVSAGYAYLASTGGLSEPSVVAERGQTSVVIVTGYAPRILPVLPMPAISVSAGAPTERITP